MSQDNTKDRATSQDDNDDDTSWMNDDNDGGEGYGQVGPNDARLGLGMFFLFFFLYILTII